MTAAIRPKAVGRLLRVREARRARRIERAERLRATGVRARTLPGSDHSHLLPPKGY